MPLQNRVDPAGRLHAVAARGTLMGNRGRLHDGGRRIGRHAATKRWIACTLEPVFGKRAGLMMPTSYTELFFLDEATAFAAGHRPCWACRRADYLAFVAAWREAGLPLPAKGGITDAIDARLEGERRAASRPRALPGELPRGAIVRGEGGEFALVEEGGRLLRWSFGGYMRQPGDAAGHETVEVVTPMSIIEVLRAGYRPAVHPSAAGVALDAASSPA